MQQPIFSRRGVEALIRHAYSVARTFLASRSIYGARHHTISLVSSQARRIMAKSTRNRTWRFGIWCPAPLSIRPDMPVKPAFDALTRHGGGVDGNYLYAVDVLRRAEQLGFEITLIAQRFFGPDLNSWMLAAALAAQTTQSRSWRRCIPASSIPR